MTNILIGFALGLLVGWNFLPQPEFVKNLVEKVTGYFKKPEQPK